MASALYVLTSKGKQLLLRNYRPDCPLSTLNTFIDKVVNENEVNTRPVFESDGYTFVWLSHNGLYFVLISRINSNAAMLTTYLHNLIRTLTEYIDHVAEESIRDNFVVIYELLDEMMDFGYPQFTEGKVLKHYITQESHRLSLTDKDAQRPKELPSAASGAEGACPWRPEGIVHKRNEVYVDVTETQVLLVNANGTLLNSEIQGAMKMKSRLSGMPVCQMQLCGKDGGSASPADLGDVKYHQCVKLRSHGTSFIQFVPPDGEFDLMTYRITRPVRQLINVETEVVNHGARVEFMVKAKSQIKRASTNVVITVPVPPDADTPNIRCTNGTVKYLPDKDVLQWTIKV